MGGFMAYDGNEPVYVLFPAELESYSLTGNGDFPRISKMEIQDKSKGDFISKAVVILQTSWFVIQCIARGVPRPTDHRARARHNCICGSQLCFIPTVVGQTAEHAMWGATIPETNN
jgi:hypothetical protein